MKSIKLIMPVLMAVSLLAFSATEIDGIYVWKDGKTYNPDGKRVK